MRWLRRTGRTSPPRACRDVREVECEKDALAFDVPEAATEVVWQPFRRIGWASDHRVGGKLGQFGEEAGAEMPAVSHPLVPLVPGELHRRRQGDGTGDVLGARAPF